MSAPPITTCTTAPTETGLNIASNGVITFARGQTFPGTGTITGVTAGTDLTGGGTSGNVTLNLNTAATNALYAQLGAVNTFSANQTINGSLTATSSGTGVIGSATATTGNASGVLGESQSTSGYGIQGLATAT